MRNRLVKAMCRVPMNLQLFAEGDGAGTADGGNGGGSEGDDNSGANGEDTPPSFDDFLKTGDNQAEFDRRLQKAINTAVTNEQKKWQAMTDDKLSEAEKLAKMTEEEKTKYLQQKREKNLTDREAAVTRKELMAEAKNTLASDNLPVELAEVLDYTDADSCMKRFSESCRGSSGRKVKRWKAAKESPGNRYTESS